MISRSWRCINSSNGGGRREFSSGITSLYTPHEGKCERFVKHARYCAGVSIRRRSLRLQIKKSGTQRSRLDPLNDLTIARRRCLKKQRNELIKEDGDDVSLDRDDGYWSCDYHRIGGSGLVLVARGAGVEKPGRGDRHEIRGK